jgi:uroporphyrinogen-III synthase
VVGVSAPARVLEGLTIGVTADRRAAEQAQMLEQRGARVLLGPALETALIDAHDGTRAATESLLASPPDVVVANTALGIRTWLSMADAWGMTEDIVAMLATAYVAARGPKAAGALLALGVEIDWRAPAATLSEVVDHLVEDRGVVGRRIALQVDGRAQTDALARLVSAGAEVVEISTYRWAKPKDAGPALRLIDAACNGKVDALTFTAAPAVHNLFELAADVGVADALADALNGPVLAMCVGPVCRAAAVERGVDRAREPAMPRLGGMVKALADELATRRRTFTVDGVTAEVQGSMVTVVGAGDGASVSLATRERWVFEVLSRRPGVVVPRQTLLEEVWGSAHTDPHALEVTVGRLRRRLAPTGLRVDAVHRRGYRLTSG